MGRIFGPHVASLIYDALVEYAGASERGRENFIHCATYNGITEYRFQGGLGFGGKFYSDGRVSCYSEDMTDARRYMIRNTNAALRMILK